jgi:hypothetical protein
VACAIGLAASWLVVLLLCARHGALAVAAAGGSESVPARAWAEPGEIGPTWTSTQPVVAIVDEDNFVWSITQHGVTITFYQSSVVGRAWFTFTPKSPTALPEGYLPTPYFFDLDSEYMDSHQPVSLGKNGIQIELVYDPFRLGEIEPNTLQFFHEGPVEWVRQGGEVDLVDRTITLWTKRTESFGVGGMGPKERVYLPIVSQ